jgi:hypothetical protein
MGSFFWVVFNCFGTYQLLNVSLTLSLGSLLAVSEYFWLCIWEF